MAGAGSSVPGPCSSASTRLPSSRKGAVRTSGALSRNPAWSERGTIAIAALVSACGDRSEERGVGKEWVSKVRSRRSACNKKTQNDKRKRENSREEKQHK